MMREREPSDRGRLWKRARLLLPVAGLVVVLWVLVRLIDVRQVMKAMAGANPFWVGLAALLAVVLTFMSACRLWIFCRIADQQVLVTRCWSGVMASLSLNAVLPSRGGDLAKAFFIVPSGGSLGIFIGITMLERVVDIFALSMLALMGSIWMGMRTTAWLAVAAACLPIGIIALLGQAHRLPWIGGKLHSLGEAARSIPIRPRLFSMGILFSLCFWFLVIGIMRSLLHAVGTAIPAGAVTASTPLAVLAGILPVTISGIGTRDGVLALLLQDFAPAETVLAASLLYTIITYWFLALLGVAVLGRKTLRKVRSVEEQASSGQGRDATDPSASQVAPRNG